MQLIVRIFYLKGELLMHKNVKKAMLSLLFCSVAVGTAGPVQAADFFAPLPAKTPAATDTTGHPDNFYQSDKVTKTAVTFNNIYDMKVAGNLFVPKDMKKAEKLPAIIVGHPMGAVKEQSSDLYAQKLAEKGFVTLAIDLSYWGQSEGQPRNSVNPDVYAEDFSAAADYLGKQSFVNRDKIGVLGICGSGSFVISAAKIDPRLKAVATVSMYNMGNANRWGLHKSQSVEQRKAVLEAAAQERWAEADGAPVKYTSGTTHAIDSTTDPIQKEFYDFYRTTRGSYTSPGEDPEHTTHPTLVSNVKFMNFYPFEDIETISPRPMLFITGDQAHSKEFSEDAYRRAGNPKELYYVKGAGHVDLYDKVDLIPWNKLTEFFTKYLKN